jgi:hypothetical protein
MQITIASRLRPLTIAALLVSLRAVLALAAACSGGSDDGDEASGGTNVTGTLSVSITLAATEVAAGAPIPVTVTLRNEGSAPVTVARPVFMPSMVFLEVTPDGGDPVPFDGPWTLLRPLAADGFVTLAGDESTTGEFDLAEFYTLAAGSYSVVPYYRNAQDGASAGLNALVIEPADEIAGDAVALEVR